MVRFRYSAEILAGFEAIRGGVIHASGLTNGPSPESLRAAFAAEQETVLRTIGETPLSALPSVAAWRRAFSAFGVKPTQYRSAAEALLRRLTKSGEIPSINLLVDLANLVSIRHRLPVAVFDQAQVTGTTTVRFADGDEEFTDLGASVISHPQPGEVVFVDDARHVSARRWCWRQSSQSAAGPATTEVLITVEGLHDGAATSVAQATADLEHLLREHQPGAAVSSALLGPGLPLFEN